MRNKIKNILASHSLIILLSAVYFGIYNNNFDFARFEYQILLTSIIMFLGFELSKKIESKYRIVEMLIEFLVGTLITLTFGHFFKWYEFPRVENILLIIVVVYIIFCFLDIVTTRKDLKDIEELIQAYKKSKLRSGKDENCIEVFKE